MPTLTQNQTSATAPTAASVELVTAARFVCQSIDIPEGMKSRDLAGFVSGMVEEESPLPLEHIAWGFVTARKGRKITKALAYASARNLVLGDDEPKSGGSILPSFAALHGLSFGGATWLFFLDSESLSAVYFSANESIPNRIISRYHHSDLDDWSGLAAVRAELLKSINPDSEDTVLDGIVRAELAGKPTRKKVPFSLEQKTTANGGWKAWRKTELSPESILIGADLRDPEFLSAELSSRRDGRSLVIAGGVFAAAIAIMGIFEMILGSRASQAEEALSQAEAQETAVEQLKEMEIMTKAVEATLQKQLLPFDWMMAVNEFRPEEIALTSAYMGSGDQMNLNGEGDNVKTVNDYVTALENSNRFSEVKLVEVKTGKNGATFRIELVIGDINAEPTPQPEEAEPATEVAGT
ncbi:PilN domain-containing protein [Rubellicoccus peritrichatus]|uniref:PilN domain-containing protein n=1 Tax=Rubellicoccus peritrichatus TaxID=3080537 RepID=A0AAQ3QVS2_9BACT|nr:PilN domain-containing protein [Puniceicoccus sp. CR14]WOO41928.1 PilN domain-containing protein [Puniceicoccus sp. CR14]